MNTTRDTYSKVLDEFGFKRKKETRWGETFDGPELKSKKGFMRVEFKEKDDKTAICIYGMGNPSFFKTGNLRLSEMQLRQLLTILINNHI